MKKISPPKLFLNFGIAVIVVAMIYWVIKIIVIYLICPKEAIITSEIFSNIFSPIIGLTGVILVYQTFGAQIKANDHLKKQLDGFYYNIHFEYLNREIERIQKEIKKEDLRPINYHN